MDPRIQQLFVQVFGEHELVVFRPGLARRIGPLPALLLCQACYWQGVAGVGEWWHKLRDADRDAAGKLLPPKNRDRQSWEWELGIGRSEQQICRRVLRDQNLIEEKLVGIPARLHFRVDVERLAEFLIDDTRPDAFSQLDGDKMPAVGDNIVARQESTSPTKEETSRESHRVSPQPLTRRLDGVVVEPDIQSYMPDISTVISDFSIEDRVLIQDLLDELVGAMRAAQQSDSRQKIFDPSGWLRGVISTGFRRARCVQVQADRRRASEVKSRLAVVSQLPSIDPEKVVVGREFLAKTEAMRKRRVSGGDQ